MTGLEAILVPFVFFVARRRIGGDSAFAEASAVAKPLARQVGAASEVRPYETDPLPALSNACGERVEPVEGLPLLALNLPAVSPVEPVEGRAPVKWRGPAKP